METESEVSGSTEGRSGEPRNDATSSYKSNKEVSFLPGNAPGSVKSSYTMDDYIHARPPSFGQKCKVFLYRKGLVGRPQYLQRIYDKTPRYIYVNHALPPNMADPDTGALVLDYPRNKIRTTKYTPLSFIPKDLLYQFRKVANTYFLILVILGTFQVFGVASPGLASVPLLVIVTITAIRDAFEDYKRSASDTELNNTPIHVLQGLENVNVEDDSVSTWRKFKKKCSRGTSVTLKSLKGTGMFLFSSRAKRAEYAREPAENGDDALRPISPVISENSNAEAPPLIGLRLQRKLYHLQAPTQAPADSLASPALQRDYMRRDVGRAVFKNRKWKDINVGDFVRVRANEEVPADMVVIFTSDAEGNCFVETKNLDGETNLKNKAALHSGLHLRHARDISNTKFWIECDAPNPHLYTFNGTVHYEHYDACGTLVNSDEKEAITNENVLLRGSTLRNTKWAIGVVVYTGLESKIMLNSGITPEKTSKISRELNLSVVINFIVLFVICFISGVINGLFYDHTDTSRTYFGIVGYADTSAGNGVLSFFVALIIYQSLVPISLYVSIEIIKSAQAFFIYADVKMYYARLNFPCTPKSWSISDDLGQIEYVFSDKTGTLTQNVMEFKKCTIDGKLYGLAYTEAKQGMDKRNGVDIVKEAERWNSAIAEDRREMVGNLKAYAHNDLFREEALTFVSNDYVQDTILPHMTRGAQKRANEQFMHALALCHTVVTEASETDPTLRDFKAESPDEAALVAVARDLGIVFRERLRKTLVLDVYGKRVVYELLHIIPFTSARKRMTCILRTADGAVVMYTKGADNVIFQRLHARTSDEMLKKTALHLEDFAKEGLRTLCIASRTLEEAEVHAWLAKFKEANASIDDSKHAIIDALNDELETGLTILGGTAIEDRLQQGVPASISILSNAGIKLWVLTGDRIETAINIGFSCNLLGNDMNLLVVRPEDAGSDAAYIDELLTRYLAENFGIQATTKAQIASAIKSAKADHSVPTANSALVIDGAALALVFGSGTTEQDEELRQKFLLLGKQCRSVLCCRVSPAQKGEVVCVVKNHLDVMTLAIGDGANDVAMLQAANVGVGIAGEEGRQAVMAADYALGQFRFLTRLLLVHGRWSYQRLAEMVPCFFYKNVVFTFTCFWYGMFSNFDGSYLFEYTYLIFYNLAFTSLPVIFLAVFDQDVSDSVSLVVPQLYRSGIIGADWSQYKFMWYMADGLFQSVVAFFFPYLMYYVSFQNHEGLPVDHRFWVGVLVCAISVTACDIYIFLQQRRWDWLTLLINAFSILAVFFWTGVWSARAWVGEFYASAPQLFGTLLFWCCFFVGTMICLLPRFIYDYFKRNLFPKDIDIIRERAAKGDYKDYPSSYDPTNIEDLERHRLLQRLNEGDTELLAKIEQQVDPDANSLEHPKGEHADHTLVRAFKTIKRKTTLTRSRKNTVSSQAKYNEELLKKPLDLGQLRSDMIRRGEYKTAGRTSLERITTTHGLPGLTQAETLMSYHTRNSSER